MQDYRSAKCVTRELIYILLNGIIIEILKIFPLIQVIHHLARKMENIICIRHPFRSMFYIHLHWSYSIAYFCYTRRV